MWKYDYAYFHLSVYVNKNNCHIWGEENLYDQAAYFSLIFWKQLKSDCNSQYAISVYADKPNTLEQFCQIIAEKIHRRPIN